MAMMAMPTVVPEDEIRFTCFMGTTKGEGRCGRQCIGGRLENNGASVAGLGKGDGMDGIVLQSDGITTDANQLDLVIEVFYGNLNHSEAWMARCKTMNLQDVHVIHFSITVYIFVRVYQHIYM